MMCGDRWLTTGSPWEGDEMTEREPTEEMLLAGIAAANRPMPYINDAQKVQAIWQAMQAARAASTKVPQGVEEWLVGCEHCATIENNVLAFNMASNLRAYLSGMALVPVDGYVIEKGSEEYKEIVLTGPNFEMQTFWPDDAAYGIMQAMLAATKEKGE